MSEKTNHEKENGIPPITESPPAPVGPSRELSEEKRRQAAKKRRRRKIVRWSVVGGILLIVGIGIFSIVQNLFFTEVIIPDLLAVAYRGPFNSSISGNGEVKATKTEAVTVKAKGDLLELFVTEGQAVNVGDPLFKVDDKVIRETITEAEDTLATYQQDLNDIYEKIANLTITAPFRGKTLDVKIKEGDRVAEGAEICTLVDDSKMWLTQYFSYAFENDIKVGMSAEVSIPSTMSVVNGKVQEIQKIRKITPEGTILFEVRILLDNPGALAKDMVATATLAGPDGLVISPSEAGTLEYYREETVVSEAAGKVITLKARDYYDFSSGATLVQLEGTSYDDSIKAANEKIKKQQETLQEYYDQLNTFNAVAPMAGTIMSIGPKVGDTIEAGSTVLTISDTSAMLLEVNIDERDVSKIEVGMPVELTQEQSDGQAFFFGAVKTISLEGKYDYGYGYFPTTIEIMESEGLRAGTTLQYVITTGAKDDCLLVETGAIKYTDAGVCVFLKAEERPENAIDIEGGEAVPEGYYAVPVEVGLSDSSVTEIVSGIDEGAELYVRPGVSNDPMGGMMY
ncbi:HlyD family efflux transporter periplasmic adaptor subunit [Oscillospiraceae bacterium OttesenSCG-928-G22]|nr:HlyD family efflux transporter periplasmic adaptor subunit [Oscillospiraceae bacterium OttesenSCG-928-G22]